MEFLTAVWWWVATVLIVVAAVLFMAKVGWNFVVPYALLRRGRQVGGRAAGISMHPMVELALLAVAVALAFTSGQNTWLEPLRLTLAGTALVSLSYLHLFLIPAVFFRPSSGDDARNDTAPD